MKIIIKFFLILILMVLTFFTHIYSKNPKGLAFDKTNYDFGKVWQNDRLNAIFHSGCRFNEY